jgi:hypothetical protein
MPNNCRNEHGVGRRIPVRFMGVRWRLLDRGPFVSRRFLFWRSRCRRLTNRRFLIDGPQHCLPRCPQHRLIPRNAIGHRMMNRMRLPQTVPSPCILTPASRPIFFDSHVFALPKITRGIARTTRLHPATPVPRCVVPGMCSCVERSSSYPQGLTSPLGTFRAPRDRARSAMDRAAQPPASDRGAGRRRTAPAAWHRNSG